MLAIRLRRTGSKQRPFFRVVVTDSRAARDSSFVEVLGHLNARSNPEKLELNRERFDHWVKAGAVPRLISVSLVVFTLRASAVIMPRWIVTRRSISCRPPRSVSTSSVRSSAKGMKARLLAGIGSLKPSPRNCPSA